MLIQISKRGFKFLED